MRLAVVIILFLIFFSAHAHAVIFSTPGTPPAGGGQANCIEAQTGTPIERQPGDCIEIGGGLLPDDRNASTNWRMAGLLSIGDIPNRTTQCGSALTPIGGGSDDSSQINTAISACPSGDFVLLNPGIFTVTEGHTISLNNGITLRGAGPGPGNDGVSTLITRAAGPGGWPNSGCSQSGAWGATLGCDVGGNSPSAIITVGGTASISQTTTLSADGAQGNFSIQVTSATGFSVGGLVLVDELANGQAMADAAFNNGTGTVWAEPDYRVEWNQHNPTVAFFDSACNGYANNNNFSCGTNGDECAYSIRCGGVQEELHYITAISGNTITFDSPLTLRYRTSNSAGARFYPSTSFVKNAGVENLSLSHGDNGNLLFVGCMYCWAKTVESSIWLNQGGFYFGQAAFRDQLDTFYVHNAAWPVNGGGGYAINSTFGASEEYIVNGIDLLANKVIVFRASGSGTVVAYNYMDDGYIGGNDTWIETGLNCSHLVGSHDCLFEGNLSFNSDSDFTHGNSTHNTFFRNWLTGFRAAFTSIDGASIDDSTGCCGPQRAVGDHAYSYWDSFIGNVAGKSGLVGSWNYRCAAGNADSGCSPALFNLGWNDTSVSGSLADGTMALSYPQSPSATITGPGCTSSGSNCVPVVDGNFDYKTNSVQWASNDSAHLLPNSFYLSSKPSFFAAGGGYPWPWVTPDQSPAIQTGCSGTCSGLPAKARYDAGTPFTQP